MICIVTALSSEASPLIKYYNLKQQEALPFSLYIGDAISLIVSGVGKIQSACATGFLAAQNPGAKTAWLNVGICGFSKGKIGSSYLSKKIYDTETNHTYYPTIFHSSNFCFEEIATVNSPWEINYSDRLIEMEASGFFAAASRFSLIECIQCLKVVSDSHPDQLQKVNKHFVKELVNQNIPSIDKVIDCLTKNLDTLKPYRLGEESESILRHFHFTTTEKIKLKELIRRLKALRALDKVKTHTFDRCKSAKEVLDTIEKILNNEPINY